MIEQWLNEGVPRSHIADRLHHNRSTIYQETKRETVTQIKAVNDYELNIAFELYHHCSSFYQCLRRYLPLFANPSFNDMSFDELLDHEESVHKSNKMSRLLKQAKFPEKTAIEDIIYDPDRKLNKDLLAKLATGDYITKGRNILFKGGTGAGKTWIATAFGVQACRYFFKVNYTRLPDLLEEFKVAKYKADGSYSKLVRSYTKVVVLILDEWLLFELSNEEAWLLLEIINARYTAKKSNIFCSQFDIKGWYEKLGNGTLAEAILD